MTIFQPIIHNLNQDDAGFKEAQLYNSAIGSKEDYLKHAKSLHEKILAERYWKAHCKERLLEFKQAVMKL
jgi:hypothetical protein